ITAIKNLNEGKDLERYINVDATLRYFAAHNTVVNLDSYSTTLQQNYYIYERDGQLTFLPWDYGLSFGGFLSNSLLNVINFPIDTPVSGISMESRPLLNKLLEVEEYRERYHEYLWQIVEGYFESGLYLDTIRNLDSKIGAFVKENPSSFVTYEQYAASLPHLVDIGRLRAVSIRRQLDGTIPATTEGQIANRMALVFSPTVNLNALGSLTMGMGQGGMANLASQENLQDAENALREARARSIANILYIAIVFAALGGTALAISLSSGSRRLRQ
ncbi:MAG: CotH kinase family protein, partial [Clostridiales bacterium]|nr:CotH kinase family protein [Clostridiales bacterium]